MVGVACRNNQNLEPIFQNVVVHQTLRLPASIKKNRVFLNKKIKAFQHFQPVLCKFHMRCSDNTTPCHVRLHTLFYSIKTSDVSDTKPIWAA